MESSKSPRGGTNKAKKVVPAVEAKPVKAAKVLKTSRTSSPKTKKETKKPSAVPEAIPAAVPSSVQAAPAPVPAKSAPANTPRWDDGDLSLPETYGEDTLVMLARDPWWVYVYWEKNGESRDRGVLRLTELGTGESREMEA